MSINENTPGLRETKVLSFNDINRGAGPSLDESLVGGGSLPFGDGAVGLMTMGRRGRETQSACLLQVIEDFTTQRG